MPQTTLSQATRERRAYWVAEIEKLSGDFGNDASRVEHEVAAEVAKDGSGALKDHLHTCGAIPESYGASSSEEKLYSKYTDTLLALAFRHLGISCAVLTERAGAADVEGTCKGFSFVADAKAFRLSRTAKNQKDFKVHAMDNWKRGKDFAVVVCPIYQLPSRSSQIYQQATAQNVCVLSYSHVVFLVTYADRFGAEEAQRLFGDLLACVARLNASKDAVAYWQGLNRQMIGNDPTTIAIWSDEKRVAMDAMNYSKEEGLLYLANERKKLMGLSREQAISELLRVHNIDGRMTMIARVGDNGLLNLS